MTVNWNVLSSQSLIQIGYSIFGVNQTNECMMWDECAWKDIIGIPIKGRN